MQAKDVIARARTVLQDAGKDYWPAEELAGWLSDGRQEAYVLRPDLYQTSATMALAAGSAQQLPDGSRRLFGVLRNVSHPSRRQVTYVEAETLARHRPNWRASAPAGEIWHYLYDPVRGGAFDVYPQAEAGTTVEISYAKPPAAIPVDDSAIELTEEGEHAPALVDYVLYRAFLKEADTVPADHDRAAAHFTKFSSQLTGSAATKAASSPNA